MHRPLAVTSLAAAGLSLQAAAASFPGCDTSPTLGSGVKEMDVNGQTREYMIQLPETYDARVSLTSLGLGTTGVTADSTG